MALTISQPDSVASRGEEIYREKLKTLLEPKESGKFVAIEVNSEKYFVGNSSGEALKLATAALPDGVFHLMKIGASTAFTLTAIHRHGNLARNNRDRKSTRLNSSN